MGLPNVFILSFAITYLMEAYREYVYLLAAIVTIISLSAAPFVYFIQKWHNEKSERKRASNNLCRELKDTLESLDREKFKDNAMYFKTNNDKEIFFMNRTLNHDFYDSLIFSGKINFLKPELQQQVQNIFNQIKTHNEYLDLTRTVAIEKQEQFPKDTYEFYIWMDDNEKKLLKDIPIMIKNLEDDFDVKN